MFYLLGRIFFLAPAICFTCLAISCDKAVDTTPLAPQVSPVVSAVGSDTVVVKWGIAGDHYSYDVLLGYDSINDNDFRNVSSVVNETTDTSVIIRGLIPNAWYKVVVTTNDRNFKLAPNHSWPPVRFKTE